jgi:pyruvate formate lyase activating enzyme
VLVTNGCIKTEPAKAILKLTDAANVDLKCFSAETYNKVLGGAVSGGDLLQTVLDFIKLCYETGIHLEITTLVVPGLNDSQKELDAIADFIAGLDKEIPWHLTAYRPEYRWNAPRTDPGFLRNAANEAGRKLRYVHTGNI